MAPDRVKEWDNVWSVKSWKISIWYVWQTAVGEQSVGPNAIGLNNVGLNDFGLNDISPNDISPNDVGPNDVGLNYVSPNDGGLNNVSPNDVGPTIDVVPLTEHKFKNHVNLKYLQWDRRWLNFENLFPTCRGYFREVRYSKRTRVKSATNGSKMISSFRVIYYLGSSNKNLWLKWAKILCK